MNEQNSIANTVASLFRGRWISPFTKSSVLSKKKHNEVLARLNPLLNISAYLGDTAGQVNYSENNVIIKLPKVAGDSGSSSVTIEQYNASHTYAVGDLVWTGATFDIRQFWLAEVANAPGVTAAAPIYPEPSTGVVWRLLAGRSAAEPYKVTGMDSGGKAVICQPYGWGDGTPTPIATPPELWIANFTETIRGDSITYSSADYVAQTRIATRASDGAAETQYITRPYIANDIIWAARGRTFVTISGSELSLYDTNRAARAWMGENSA